MISLYIHPLQPSELLPSLVYFALYPMGTLKLFVIATTGRAGYRQAAVP